MTEEVDGILARLKDWSATKKDVIRLKEIADLGDTKASLNYGICLFVGHLVEEDKEKASKYFEKVYLSGTIEELNELASFYDEVGGPAYRNMSDMVVEKAMSKFMNLPFKNQLEFLRKNANIERLKEVIIGFENQ